MFCCSVSHIFVFTEKHILLSVIFVLNIFVFKVSFMIFNLFYLQRKNILFLFCFFKGKKSPRNVFLLLRYLVYLFFEMKMFSPPGKKKSPDYFFTSFRREIHEYPRLQQQTAASLLRTLPGNKFHLQNQPADRIQDNHILTCRTKTVKAL